jgi:hypothetical protein
MTKVDFKEMSAYKYALIKVYYIGLATRAAFLTYT